MNDLERCPKCGAARTRGPNLESLACRIREQDAELTRLKRENLGLTKANKLLLAGMESQSELMDGLKQRTRTLEAELAGGAIAPSTATKPLTA